MSSNIVHRTEGSEIAARGPTHHIFCEPLCALRVRYALYTEAIRTMCDMGPPCAIAPCMLMQVMLAASEYLNSWIYRVEHEYVQILNMSKFGD